MTDQSTSRYRRKVGGKRQMYGNGKTGCAHHLPSVEIHKGPIEVEAHNRRVGTGRSQKSVRVPRRVYDSISEVPMYLLPIFTDEKTARTN